MSQFPLTNTKKSSTATVSIPRPLLLFLLVLLSTTYLTATSFIGAIANNVGPFEFLMASFFIITTTYFLRHSLPVYTHFLVRILGAIILIAGINLVKMADRAFFGVTQWLLLVYALILLLIFYNWLIRFPDLLRYLLRFLVYAAALAALWATVDSYLSGGSFAANGPFSNRVHMGIYLTSSFWVTLIYLNLPNISRREKMLVLLFIPLLLYGVAISGRRSVYLSLISGLVTLIISLVFLFPQERKRLFPAIMLGLGFLLILYFGESFAWLPKVVFFQERVGTIEDRLRAFAGDEEVLSDDENFILLQRQGMWAAVQDYPILGIGWGAFLRSPYSPTGHEMHSTPQRFFAELGLVGLILYLILTGYLLFGSARLTWRARGTPYQLPTLLLAIALWSLHVSWAYNRSLTDRTYWLLLVILMGFELLVQSLPAPKRKPILLTIAPDDSR
ncbi:MAG: hypothetical protein KJ069_09410 [Anaerolineae bacterium]|nr:hypothetical protein [Anaerolineae bacterium]